MRRVGAFAISAVLLGGCQCNREKAAEPKPTPAPVATSAAPSTGEPILSALRNARQGTCDWLKIDPVTKTETLLASIDEVCDEIHVSWSHDLSRALLWMPMSYATDKPVPAKAWEMTIGKPDSKEMDLPKGIEEAGFDASGAIVALVAEELNDAEMKSGKIVRAGKTYQLEEGAEGLPILVHAFKREGSAWKISETKLSDTGWDLATGVGALDASRALGPRTSTILFTLGDAGFDAIEDTALLEKLRAAAPFDDEEFASWTQSKTEHGPVYFLEECFEISCAFRRVVFRSGDTFTAAPGFAFTDSEPFEAFVRGPWLLAVTPDGTKPHLWDLRTRTLAWESKEDGSLFGVVFWP